MARQLGLHHMNAMDLSPLAFVEAAAEAGCRCVSLFCYSPPFALPGIGMVLDFPAVTPGDVAEMKRLLADTGVRVAGVEFFPIVPDRDVADYLPALALGAELGATRTVTHIHDTDDARALDRFGALCDLAAGQGLSVGIEFTPMARGCPTIERAAWFVEQVGWPNAGIAVDFLHVVRSGGSAAGIAALDPRLFTYAQICDGHGLHVSDDYLAETGDRVLPGEGDFPLAAILDTLPAGIELEVEVPTMQRRGSAVEYLREALGKAWALVG